MKYMRDCAEHQPQIDPRHREEQIFQVAVATAKLFKINKKKLKLTMEIWRQ
jgi:hypothetical protein